MGQNLASLDKGNKLWGPCGIRRIWLKNPLAVQNRNSTPNRPLSWQKLWNRSYPHMQTQWDLCWCYRIHALLWNSPLEEETGLQILPWRKLFGHLWGNHSTTKVILQRTNTTELHVLQDTTTTPAELDKLHAHCSHILNKNAVLKLTRNSCLLNIDVWTGMLILCS